MAPPGAFSLASSLEIFHQSRRGFDGKHNGTSCAARIGRPQSCYRSATRFYTAYRARNGGGRPRSKRPIQTPFASAASSLHLGAATEPSRSRVPTCSESPGYYMSDFTLAFEMYRARSFEAYCFDENENPVVPRRTLNGDYHFDHFADRIASVSIVPSNLVTVCATKSRPKGYYEPTVVGNFRTTHRNFKWANGRLLLGFCGRQIAYRLGASRCSTRELNSRFACMGIDRKIG